MMAVKFVRQLEAAEGLVPDSINPQKALIWLL